MIKFKYKLLVGGILFSMIGGLVWSKSSVLSVSTKTKLSSPRPWLGGEKSLQLSYQKQFFNFYQNLQKKNYGICRSKLPTPAKTPERLKVWWSYMRLECVFQRYSGSTKIKRMQEAVLTHLKVLRAHKGLTKPFEKHLASVLLSLAGERNYVLTERETEVLVSFREGFTDKQTAQFFNFMALRALKKNQYSEAAKNYHSAYELSEDQIYATRLKTLLNNQPDLKPHYTAFSKRYQKDLGRNVNAAKFNRFYKQGKELSAIREGVKVLNASVSVDRKIIGRMFKFLYRRNKGLPLKSSVEKALLQCHARCLLRFAQRYFSKHKYNVARELAQKSFSKKQSVTAKMLMGFSSLQLGEYTLAKKYYKESRNESEKNSPNFFEALFRQGLILFRENKPAEVVRLFKGYFQYKEINDFNLRMTYWYWRALQSVNKKEAEKVRDQLIALYPLTYYGLKANQEKNNGRLVLPNKGGEALSVSFDGDRQREVSWSNYKSLVEMMSFELAQLELRGIFDLGNDIETVLYSRFSSLAANHFSAIRAMNLIWDKDPLKYFTRETVKLTLPIEFESLITDYAQKNDLEPALIQSLIKQESSFSLKAVSSSNAMGLMQLIPMTAKDSAKYLRLKTRNIRQRVFEPELNVRLGTSYFRRLHRAFKGNIPFALAAYNAGIGNIRRWIKPRKGDLEPLIEKNSFRFRDEIWMDELPWQETNFYVKAILRNLVLYRFYYHDVKVIPEPSWEKPTRLAQ